VKLILVTPFLKFLKSFCGAGFKSLMFVFILFLAITSSKSTDDESSFAYLLLTMDEPLPAYFKLPS